MTDASEKAVTSFGSIDGTFVLSEGVSRETVADE